MRQLRSLGPVAGKRILEVGAGTGRDSLVLGSEGAVVFMLDYSDRALRVMHNLAQQSGQSVRLVRGDAFQLPFKTGSMDLVFHQGLLEHFIDPGKILSENFRVLKSGGFGLADVPQRYHLYTVVKHILIRLNRWFAGWETEFSLRQLQHLFRSAGFAVYDSYGDWMRPSFFYRALREILKKVSWRLPLYPKSIPGFSDLRGHIRTTIRRSSWAFYTYMDIGVIGRKNG